MTPQEKAKELVDKFRNEYKWVESDYPVDLYREAKQCALIAVNEIISLNYNQNIIHMVECFDSKCGCCNYWQQVKKKLKTCKPMSELNKEDSMKQLFVDTLIERIKVLEDALNNLIFTASKLWDEVKPIKDSDCMTVTHPIIEQAKQALQSKLK